MTEATAERNVFQVYWHGLLMSSVLSHPYTNDLMHIAIRVGEFQAMHYKLHPGIDAGGNPIPNRPRPSQLSPALMPPIAVPGHASYPSGHSTQSHLLSGLLAQVMPASVTAALPALPGAPAPLPLPAPPPPVAGAPPFIPWIGSLLDRLAERVTRNREVLGLHYPSDSAAGRLLAAYTLFLLLQCQSVIDIIIAAQREWP
jgi:membrane-associated phospholipid phosphatase